MPILPVDSIERSTSSISTVDYDDINITALANGNFAISYTTFEPGPPVGNYFSNLRVFTPDSTEILPPQGWADASHASFAALPDGRMALAFLDEGSGDFKLTFGTDLAALSTPISVGDVDPGSMVLAGAFDGRILMLGMNGDTIVGQYLGTDGTTLGSVFTVYTAETGVSGLADLKVVNLPDGTFQLAWNETTADGVTYATATLKDQTASAPIVGPVDASATYHLDSLIALAGGGTASVTSYLGGSTHQVILDINGVTTYVANTTDVADQGSVAQLADGRFVVTWHLVDPTDTYGDTDGGIRAQIFNADGTADGDSFQVDTQIAGDERQPTVIALPDGRFTIAWHTENAAGNSVDGVASRSYDPLHFTASSPSGESWRGGDLGDNITGADGADHLYGMAGNDVITGRAGADELDGGAGRDTLLGGEDSDTLIIHDGDDSAGEVYNGGAGTDVIQISGTDGSYDIDLRDDSIAQIESIRLLDPGLNGGTATLRIMASQLSGLIVNEGTGSNVKATIDISMGDLHQYFANAGALLGFGKAGDVIMVEGTKGADTIFGNGYNERLFGFGGNDSIVGGGGNDSLDGGDNDDSVMAGSGQDTLRGGNGNDTLQGGGGKDTIDGGAGSHDRADYSYAAVKVSATLSGGKATVKLSSSDTDKLTGIEDLAGGGKGDALKGDTHANRLIGNAGADTLSGGTGNDSLHGGAGTDSLSGGSGNDHFIFDTDLATAGADRITDFSHGHDKIDLAREVMVALSAGPHLTTAEFYAHAGATHGHDGSDRIVYNTSNGWLYYDADGSGGGAAVHIATLNAHPTLSAGDFNIV